MKKKEPLLILLLCIFFCANAAGKTIIVCKTCPVKTIKEAIKQAHENDTVMVKPGIYKEVNIVIDKCITLLGEGKPTIDGEDKGEVITILADDVSVAGFKIMNIGTSYTADFAAVRVVKSSGFRIENLELENLFFGIYLEKSTDGKVLHNVIKGDAKNEYNSGNGIQLWHCNNVEIRGNTVMRVRDGIYLEFSDRVAIVDNFSKNNLRYGLHFMFSNNNKYEHNTFEANGAGVAVMFSKNIEMYRNVFKKNWGTAAYGLLLKEINDSKIHQNVFEENTVGINVEGCNRIDYEHNDFIRNGWAVKVRGACYNNRFNANNFLYNSFDISYNSRLNDNEFNGNFWSSYSGYDLDKNGIGDVPYRPVKLFSYIVNRTPETIVLLRSLFIDIIDFSEKVSPVFTPDNLIDQNPKLKPILHAGN